MATVTVSAELLRRSAHLHDLTHDALVKLARMAEERVVARGMRLFDDMDPADSLYLLVQGEVALHCELGNGETRLLDTVHAGELFAWSALVEPYRYTSNATTASDCELISFDARKLRQACAEDVDLGYQVLHKIVQILSSRLESARVQLAAL